MVFTSLPPIALAVFEKDVDEACLQKYPKLYQQSVRGSFFSPFKFVCLVASALWHSVAIFFLLRAYFGEGAVGGGDGLVSGYWIQAWVASTLIMILVTSKYYLELRYVPALISFSRNLLSHWVQPMHMTWILSFVLYISLIFAVDLLKYPGDRSSSKNVHSIPSYYIFAVIAPLIAILPDFVIK